MALTREEACSRLGVDANANSSAIEAELQARPPALEARRASAPTPALQQKYARQIEEIAEAGRVLLSPHCEDGMDLAAAGHLPVAWGLSGILCGGP
jgi:hypothetical protein